MNIHLDNGKYTVVREGNGRVFKALRYGEEWRDLIGDNLILALCDRIEELEAGQDTHAKPDIRWGPIPPDNDYDGWEEVDDGVWRRVASPPVATPPNSFLADTWAKMDKFDRAWFCQSVSGTLLEGHRKAVEASIYDHEQAGNWDVSMTMRKFKYTTAP